MFEVQSEINEMQRDTPLIPSVQQSEVRSANALQGPCIHTLNVAVNLCFRWNL